MGSKYLTKSTKVQKSLGTIFLFCAKFYQLVTKKKASATHTKDFLKRNVQEVFSEIALFI
jgi:hypothetical protein